MGTADCFENNKNQEQIAEWKIFQNLNFGPKGSRYKVEAKGGTAAKDTSTIKNKSNTLYQDKINDLLASQKLAKLDLLQAQRCKSMHISFEKRLLRIST